MNGAGNANQVLNLQHQGSIAAWHFIYFGYSKAQRRAYVNLVLRTGAQQIDYTNTNHYWAEKFFFVLRDARYPNYNG